MSPANVNTVVLINFMYFKSFNILLILMMAVQYLDSRVGLVLLCSKGLPYDGSAVPKHVAVS
jgi:hypothetical protein